LAWEINFPRTGT